MSVAQKRSPVFRCLSVAAFLGFCACAFGQTEDVPPNRQPVDITQGQPAQPTRDNAKPPAGVPATAQPIGGPMAPGTPGTAASETPPSLLDHPAEPARINLASGKLTVHADNSSLSDILRQVSKAGGMKIDGLQARTDQRIFGSYGPGTPRDVLSELLNGSGYNVMMLGQMPSGVPRELALTSRTAGGAPNQPQQATGNAQDDNGEEDVQATQYPDDQQNNFAPPATSPETRNGLRTPQQILQELQRMHQQQQQDQQDQQNQQQDDQQQNDQPQN